MQKYVIDLSTAIKNINIIYTIVKEVNLFTCLILHDFSEFAYLLYFP